MTKFKRKGSGPKKVLISLLAQLNVICGDIQLRLWRDNAVHLLRKLELGSWNDVTPNTYMLKSQ